MFIYVEVGRQHRSLQTQIKNTSHRRAQSSQRERERGENPQFDYRISQAFPCVKERKRRLTTLPLHCFNSKVCLPIIPGERAVSFKTVWFFPHNYFHRTRG
jgi:hypothetical protein